MSDLIVRQATQEDAEGILGVLNPIIETGLYSAMDTPFTIDQERDYIRQLPARAVLNLAVRQSDQRIVGCQSLDPFASYTHAFDHVGVMGTFIALDCRRQGIAKRLFESTFDAATRLQYEKIFTFIRADNSAAQLTYLHHGFRIIGIAHRQAKIKSRYIDELLVEKFL